MSHLILSSALVAAGSLVVWYVCFARYNHRRGDRVLRWIEAACGSRGKVVDQKWLDVSRMQIQLAFAAHWFENARVTIRLRPRPLPLHWLYAIWQRQKEVLTFEADLGGAPGSHIQVFRHHWLTHTHTERDAASQAWQIHRPGQVVLTTRADWSNELVPVVNTLMMSRGHRLLSVRLRPESPHLAATLPLDAISDEQHASSFLKVLRALAEGASARHGKSTQN